VRIHALDVHTGRLLWRSDLPRLVRSGQRGTVLVAAPLDKDGRPVPSAQGPSIESFAESPRLVRALDAATGRAIWTYQVPAGWRAVLGDDPSGADTSDRFVVVAPTGQAHAVDLASGRVQATATIAVDPSGTADRNQRGQAVLHGNQLLVTHLRQGRPSLTAYGTDTLSPQWTAEISTLTTDVSRCLQLLCLRDSREVHAVMPTTGTKVWTANGLTRYSVVDRWLYEAPPFNQPGSARLVDPATARTLLDLGRWRFAAQDPGQPPLFELVEQSSRIWLGLLVPGPRIRPLGTVTGISEAVPPYGPPPCHAGTGYLFCTTTTQQLRIWHFRR
jgi:outer membrane protein assembly factor BamB